MSGYGQDGLPIIGPYKQLVKKGDAVTCSGTGNKDYLIRTYAT